MKKIKVLLSALVLSVSALLIFAAPKAFAATKTWDGGGSDDNMTTGANWNADSAPVAGDDLVFPASVAGPVINDFTAGTSFNTITFSGAATATDYTVSGNSMIVVAGISESMTGTEVRTQTLSLPLVLNAGQTLHANEASTLAFTGVISGSGALTMNGEGEIDLNGANTFTGAVSALVVVRVKDVTGLGTAAGATTVDDTGKVIYELTDKNATVTEPFVFEFGDYQGESALRVNAFSGGSSVSDSNLTFSGSMTFNADTLLSTAGKLTLTGALSGSGKRIELTLDAPGTLVLNGSSNNTATVNGTYGAGVVTTKTLTENLPARDVAVPDKNTVIITGTYKDVTVYSGGLLKGTGTVAEVLVKAGGTIAPGLSPGCLNTGNLTFQSGSTYEFEVGGTTACTEYDQLAVTGTVDLGSGTLNLSLFNSFKPTVGQKYTIISNDASDAVTGTFNGLAQGATFTASGYIFSISYTGGDGNDVELTVTAVAPDTGFALIKNNPLVTMAAMVGAAGAIMIIARRGLKPAVARARRR